jgi:hypothetical protein
MLRASLVSAAALLLCAAIAEPASAGANSAKLSCAANSDTPITLVGRVPADIEELDILVAEGTDSRRLRDDGTLTTVVQDLRNGVFVLVVRSRGMGDALTSLHAIPKTVRATFAPNEMKASFDAFLTTPRPPNEDNVRSAADMLERVRVSCEYHYEL